MTPLPFYKHGERVRLEYLPLPGSTEGPMGLSTDEQRSEGHLAGVVKRFKKQHRAADTAQALGWIKATYKDAIEYTGMTKETRGQAFLIALLGGALGIGVGILAATDLFQAHDWVIHLLDLIAAPTFFAFGLWIISFAGRLDLFRPADQPVIFDRKHRKVYRIVRQEMPGRWGALKHWPIMVCEYDWDLIDVEHQSEAVVGTNMARRNHFLMFLVRKSATDANIIDSFQIANAFVLGELLVAPMWEHIRRFMEEDGSHLPTPDEPLANLDPPGSWWRSLGATGVFGHGYFQHWAENPTLMVFAHVILPISLPMYLLWGTGNWLSFKTAIPVAWPDQVIQRVGPATRHG